MKKHLTGDMFIVIHFDSRCVIMKTENAYEIIKNLHFWKNEHIHGEKLIRQSDLQNFIDIDLYFRTS